MKILSIINEKGGCGKTTIAMNLVGVLLDAGKRVVVIDADPQAHLTALLLRRAPRVSPHRFSDFVLGVIDKMPLTKFANFAFVAGDAGIINVTSDNIRDSFERLSAAIAALAGQYDYVIIDTPGVAGLMRKMLVYLATDILIPCCPSLIDISAAERFLRELSRPPQLLANTATHVVISMATQTKADAANVEIAKERFGSQLMRTKISSNKTLRTYTEKGTPVSFAKRARVSKQEFVELANELFNL